MLKCSNKRGTRTTRSEETRVWHKLPAEDGSGLKWQHVHFHRSTPQGTHGC